MNFSRDITVLMQNYHPINDTLYIYLGFVGDLVIIYIYSNNIV